MKKTLFDENLTYDEAVQLIKDGVNVNERNDCDDTPLHVVKDIEIAELLINNGANVKQLDYGDNTPLHLVND
jgi:ankyrin repeat protein